MTEKHLTGWTPIGLGCSDAEVLRSPDGALHAKTVTSAHAVTALRAERDRQRWLEDVGIPAPRIVDWSERDDSATLISTTVPGVPASSAPPSAGAAAATGVGRLLAELHATADCPFDRRLSVTLAEAEQHVAAGRVDEHDFDDERVGRSATSLLEQLRSDARLRGEDVVLCHGDASLPNLFLDPVTWQPTGIVDVGRLGLADRYLDLALAARSIADDRNPGYGTEAAAAFWSGYGWEPSAVDHDAIAFYQLLDELF